MRRLNWEAPQSLEDIEFIQNVYTEEFLERLKLVFGSSYSSAWWGIVDETKPSSAQVSDTRPLVVRANSAQPLTIDVLSGMAITEDGERVVLTTAIAQRSLADIGSGAINVVYLRSFEEADTQVLDDYDVLVPGRYNTPEDAEILQVSTLSDWLAFTSVEREKFVSLAIVTVQPLSTGSLELSIDMTQNSYTWNRPWFSPVDIGHRSKIGTGITTENNPHGLQINDMVAGGLTLWQLLLEYGVIVAEDESYAKVPGVECEQIVPVGSVAIDTTGAITGLANAYYVTLLYYPSTIVRVTDTATELEELAGQVVPGTRTLYFRPSEKFSDGTAPNTKELKILYTWVQTGHPIIKVPQHNLEISNAPARQALIAGGLQITDLDDETLDFSDAGGIPKAYHVFVDATKTVRKRDQVIFCTKKLDEVGTALEPFVIAPWGPGKIKVALTGATSGPVPATLVVEIKITGKDTSGVSITENIQFTSTWEENLPGATSENSNQFLETTNTFSEVTQWQVVNRVDDGPNSAIMMWMEQDPVTSEVMADLLPLFGCFWDGTQIITLLDQRPVNTVAETPTKSPLLAGVEVQKDLAGDVITVTETIVKGIDITSYLAVPPNTSTPAEWFIVVPTFGSKRQPHWRMLPTVSTDTRLRIPLGGVIPAQCTLLQVDVAYYLGGSGVAAPFFQANTFSTNHITGESDFSTFVIGSPTPTLEPPEDTPWAYPDYHMIMDSLAVPVDQSIEEYCVEINYTFVSPWTPSDYARIGPTIVTYQEDTISTTSSIWNLSTYIAEDFRQPLWMDGTQSSLSKDVDGFGATDTYVSRPIPIAGDSDTFQRLRFVIFGADDEASLTFEYRYATTSTGVWSAWLAPASPTGPHTIDLTGSINKVQVRLNPNSAYQSDALGIGIIHWSHS